MTTGSNEQQGAALERFRRSVGFQFGFVMYSGLDVKTAIDHVCASAEALFAARSSSSLAAVEGDALKAGVSAMWEALKREACKVPDEAKQIVFLSEEKFRRAMFAAASSPLPAEPPSIICQCGHVRDLHYKQFGPCCGKGCSGCAKFIDAPAEPEGEQEPSLEDIAIQAADYLCSVASTRAQQLAFALKARVASSRATTPPETPVVAREAAEEIGRSVSFYDFQEFTAHLKNWPHGYDKNAALRARSAITAIITRYLGATPTVATALNDLFALFEKDKAGRWNFNSLSRDASKLDRIMDRLSAATTSLSETAVGREAQHHKHCSIWTVTTSGKKNPCDCVCRCTHSMFEHIRPGEHYWYEDCAVDNCPCMKFIAAPVVATGDNEGEVNNFTSESH